MIHSTRSGGSPATHCSVEVEAAPKLGIALHLFYDGRLQTAARPCAYALAVYVHYRQAQSCGAECGRVEAEALEEAQVLYPGRRVEGEREPGDEPER